MKIPIIKKSDKILDRLGIFMRIGGITLWPYIIIRPYKGQVTINHEKIHIQQQEEMLVIFFYIVYVLEWFVKLFIYGSAKSAYYNISFEREAYNNETNMTYLDSRKRWNWIKLIFTK